MIVRLAGRSLVVWACLILFTTTTKAQNVCNRVQDPTLCQSTGSCVWCEDMGKCRRSIGECTLGKDPDNGGGGGFGECSKASDQGSCEALDSCRWCERPNHPSGGLCLPGVASCGSEQVDDNDEIERNNTQGGGYGACPKIEDESSCLALDICTWCNRPNRTEGGKCLPGVASCGDGDDDSGRNNTQGGGGGYGVCPKAGDESSCVALDVCTWCQRPNRTTGGKCLPGVASCGDDDDDMGGIGNPCRGLSLDVCDNTEACEWCTFANRCLKAGNSGCNQQNRGNPCVFQGNEKECGDVDGGRSCQWCLGNQKCKRANAACGEGDDDNDDGIRGNPCKWLDETECYGNSNCQYCSDQRKCKKIDDECDEPSGETDLILLSNRGQFTVEDDGLGPTDENRVSLSLVTLTELDVNGVPVKAIDLENAQFGISQTSGIFFGGVDARRVSFSTTGENGNAGNLILEAFQIRSNGTVINEGGESFAVQQGDVKFNIVMDKFPFCKAEQDADCTGNAGEFVDVAAEIKSKQEAVKSGQDDLTYDLGGNVPLQLSGQLVLDGVPTPMPEGFPKIENVNGKTIVTVRFPKFQESVVYDPTIGYSFSSTLSNDVPGTTTGGASPSTTTTTTGTTTTPGPSTTAGNGSPSTSSASYVWAPTGGLLTTLACVVLAVTTMSI